MINETIIELKRITEELFYAIQLDIEDVKKANHESLVQRNEVKIELMNKLAATKQTLNEQLSQEYAKGIDISIYRESVDQLENKLQEVYKINGKLGSIVLPVKEMYKEIIDEITAQNGGTLIEVMA